MKNVLKTVYELDEVKEKAIEKNRYINVDYCFPWYDEKITFWEDILKEYGFSNPKIYFSGFCSQGDGACFDNDSYNMDLNLLLNNVDLTDEEREKIYSLKGYFDLTIEKNGYARHYEHEKTRYINIDCFCDKEDDEILLRKFESLLEELRESLCAQIYHDLKEEYEYLTSDSAVYDTLQVNEYFFEENGEIFSDYRVLEG